MHDEAPAVGRKKHSAPPERPPTLPPERPLMWLTAAPRGMWYEDRPGQEKPFRARWRRGDGTKDAAPFVTAEERAKFAASWLKVRAQFGRSAQVVRADTIQTWHEFGVLTNNANPLEVGREWLAFKEKASRASGSTITVGDAIEKYLAFRYAGKLSADTRRHFDKHLKERFAARFGADLLSTITDEQIEDWLMSLRHPRTGDKVEAVTRRNHRKDVNTFFDYCSRVKKWIPDNPCAGVAVPAVVEGDVKLLTLDEGRRLFALNASNPVVGRMALEAFGFLRPSSAGRIQRDDIAFDIRGLRMRGAQHKGGKTRFRQGHPDNLWAWLASASDETWAMPWWKYRNEKSIAFRVAGIDESDNRLKKTCLSAHLAWVKNPTLTARLSQHRYASTTEIYEGVMSEADGAAWFQIGPAFMPEQS